jgi:Ca2+-transporting ATPase
LSYNLAWLVDTSDFVSFASASSNYEMPSGERQPLLNGDQPNGSNNPFGIAVDDFTKLVDPKNPDMLKQLGGVQKICKQLQVDPKTGLNPDEGCESSSDKPFAERQSVYGTNVLPEAKSKSFLLLLWEAYNDKTLSMCSLQ